MESRTIIIAEAGVNHNGDITLAKKLVDAAVAAGADYVKFQTFKAEKLVTKTAGKAAYQVHNTGKDDSQFAMLKSLELSEDEHKELVGYCRKAGIKFLSTGFDEESIDFLDSLNIDFFKVPSGEITNLPYLKKIAEKKKPVVISTGMANLQEVRDAMNVFLQAGFSKNAITVLHCNTEYPTPLLDVNLKAMTSMGNDLGVRIGYSDHTQGIEVSLAAVAMGATLIEKHFTLDRNLPGPDHKASLEPHELQLMVQGIRNIEQAIAGDGEKKPSPSESKNISVARKSIHLRNEMKKGEAVQQENLIMLRPGTGISPMRYAEVVGKTARHDLPAGHLLRWNDLQ